MKPGERLAIHASKTFDVDGFRWICVHHKELGLELDDIPMDPKAYPVGAVVGSVEFIGAIDQQLYALGTKTSPWFLGPVGWLVQNPVLLPDASIKVRNPSPFFWEYNGKCESFYPMNGRLGLFDVDDGIFTTEGTEARR